MVLINCACCAAPLPHPAKQCSRCKTLYCSPACQKQHWEQGGHDKLCRKIRKGGGAEQYHADTKFKEALKVAAEACKEDAKGQKCYICGDDKEGLVRMCACRGTAGFAHVACLAEQAKILMDEAEENNLGDRAFEKRWGRWHKCGQCEQNYHGIVACALGWACWKTYVGRPETDMPRRLAMNLLGLGLFSANHAQALSVQVADLAMMRRLGALESNVLAAQSNLARTYHHCGRKEEALRLRRDVYSGYLRLEGEESTFTFTASINYAGSLLGLQRFEEAKPLFRKTMQASRRVLGERDSISIRAASYYASALYGDPTATLDDLDEAATMLEDTARTAQRVFGGAHPMVVEIEQFLRGSREALSARGGNG